MSGLADLSLIHFLDFYLMFMFVAGTIRRIDQYRHYAALVYSLPGRWPRLLKLVREHHAIFLTWATALPALLALGLSLVQLLASRLVWPDAGRPPHGLTAGRALEHWPSLTLIVPFGVAMLAVDVWGILVVGRMNRAELEKYFDQAEYWLRSRTAHVVRVFTLGYINPRRLVAVEVRKALLDASRMLNATLWWVTLQVGLRIGFGLSLWVTWALTRGAAT
jgi:hypothetical protein